MYSNSRFKMHLEHTVSLVSESIKDRSLVMIHKVYTSVYLDGTSVLARLQLCYLVCYIPYVTDTP